MKLSKLNVFRRLNTLENEVTELDDQIAALQAADTQITTDVQAIGTELASQTAAINSLNDQIKILEDQNASPDQIAALKQVATDLVSAHGAITTALANAQTASVAATS